MGKRIITPTMLGSFETYLLENEKSRATREKYLRDVRCFMEYVAGRQLDKELLLTYKSKLEREYAVRSVNSMLGALNSFMRFSHWDDLCLRQLKVQKPVYCSDDKELTRAEYVALVRAAGGRSNERLSLVLQTICATGIRVSELKYITAEAVKKGEAVVSCKGKIRKIFLVDALRRKLLAYIRRLGIREGSVFVTRAGKPLDRSNIWREMKRLCDQAGVPAAKVFPHNLRHLFARAFYSIEKDIAKLADILGHSNINTTRIYIISTGAEHRRKMETMRLVI